MHSVRIFLEVWIGVSLVTLFGLMWLCRITAQKVNQESHTELFPAQKKAVVKPDASPAKAWRSGGISNPTRTAESAAGLH